MFKKIVSNLPFSPSLMAELGFYAKRLKKEEATRRLGLILTAIALAIQSLVVFSPPESTNAANPSDIIHGGVHSKTQLLAAWDSNTQGFRDLLQHVGVTRENLSTMKEGEINTRTKGSDNGWLSWGRVSKGAARYNESALNVGSQTVYVRSLAALDTGNNVKNGGSYYPSFIGTTSTGKQFVIIKSCGNIVMKDRPVSDNNITVCDTTTRQVITIRESQFDPSKHSRNTEDCNPKPIEVCDVANQSMITIDERDFDARKHSKNPVDCQPKPSPTATCSSLTVKNISRTEMEFKAAASVTNGATIKSYTYVVKDKDGKEILRKTVQTAATTHTLKYTVEQDGQYTIEVIVGTSLGDKTASACQSVFTIEPIARCPLNPALTINDPNCQPCPGDPTLWVKDEACAAKIIRNKEAKNITQSKNAIEVTAKASDRIEYTLTAKNEGKDTAEFILSDDLSDVLEYAKLYDAGDGKLSEQTKIISWGKVSLQPGEQQQRTYVVQLTSTISSMSQGASESTSYDCKMLNTFGNSLEITVDCPTPKIVEQVIVEELPRTGPTENLIAGGAVAAIVTFLYLRSRQLNQEVRLIRREVTSGTI